MSEAERVQRLVRGRDLIAELVVTGGDFRGSAAVSFPRQGSPMSARCSRTTCGGWIALIASPNCGRRPIAASGTKSSSWHQPGGQYLSSCFTSKVKTPGGGGVMSPSQNGEASGNNHVRICHDQVRRRGT